MNEDLILYTHAMSPYGQKVKCYLLFMGINHKTVFFNPFKAEKKLPIGKTAPAITYKDESRNESSEIGKWLNELFPDKELIPQKLSAEIAEVDDWVSHKLIPAVMRDLVSYGDSKSSLIKERWRISGLLAKTVPGGITFFQRILHLLFLGVAPFTTDLINLTDKSATNTQLREKLSVDFKDLLAGGPFLCGSEVPTMADLSAYPQITTPSFQEGKDYYLPGDHVKKWVAKMEAYSPELKSFLPSEIMHSNTQKNI